MSNPQFESRRLFPNRYYEWRDNGKDDFWTAVIIAGFLALALAIGVLLWNSTRATRVVSLIDDVYITEQSARPTLPTLPY
jgi:hypothetical protein